VPSGYGVTATKTGYSTTTAERTARRLGRLRLSRRDARFETTLRTARRLHANYEHELLLPEFIEEDPDVKEAKAAACAAKIAAEDAEALARSKKFVFVKIRHKKQPENQMTNNHYAFLSDSFGDDTADAQTKP
jgi:hypothetical protein